MTVDSTTTPPEKIRDLGAGGHGGAHWLTERVTSVALLLLGSWFVASLLLLPDLRHSTVGEWLGKPGGAVPMALFVITAFTHALAGMKVVVDDYVHDQSNRFALNTLLLFLAVGGASLSLFALGKIAFGGAA